MMVFCAVLLVYTLFSSFVQCSSIITKSMIRMPNGSFNGFSRPMTPLSQLPKPEMLTSKLPDKELQAIHPFEAEEEENVDVVSAVFDKNLSFQNSPEEHFDQLSSSEMFPNSTSPPRENRDPKIFGRKDTKGSEEALEKIIEGKYTTMFEDGLEKTMRSKDNRVSEDTLETSKDEKEKLTSTISPKELSSKYWSQYKNFSHDFFNKWSSQENPKVKSNLDKRYKESSIFEIIQRIFSCFWATELFSCVQDGFDDASMENFSFFHLMSPRPPRMENELEEEFTSRTDDYDYGTVGEDEGRKRISKRIQQLIPFLLMLKMTMLPALAVMALVSGKAFLMSLLSLGIALLATFSSAVPFRADKRHEIAPPSTGSSHPTDQLPGKYYYVM